ncbi:hypothetical protein CCP3SC15_990016 [Gammaproteobacteria bacterium]
MKSGVHGRLAVWEEKEQGGEKEQAAEPKDRLAGGGRRGGDVLKGVFHDQAWMELVAALLCLS